MDRSNHYEAAFAAYLRARRVCYIAVDEGRRSLVADGSVKSIDFIVYGSGDSRLLVDVKGRRFPGRSNGKPRHAWECWAEAQDISGIEHWLERFGAGYRGLLAFAYQMGDDVALPDDVPDLWEFRGSRYLMRGVAVDEFRRHMRVRSPKWNTVDLPTAVFRDLVRPFGEFLRSDPVEECA